MTTNRERSFAEGYVIFEFLGKVVFATASVLAPLMLTFCNYLDSRMSVSKKTFGGPARNYVERLNDCLSPIKGQDKAIEKIKETTLGWLESKQPKKERERGGGLVLYFVGPSGTGKTMAAEAVTKALLGENAKPVTVSLSSIDVASPRSTDEQLFGSRTVPMGSVNVEKDTRLTNQLRFNPKTVVVFNEYDKLQKRDGTLDARLWDIADNGMIVACGRKLDCSNSVFIVTSNERPSCLGKKDSGYDDGSLTEVEHSRPFINRVNVVTFESLGDCDYVSLVKESMDNIKHYYLKKFNLILKVDEASISKIAEEARNSNRGARGIRKYVYKLYAKMVSYQHANKISEKLEEPKELYVIYDEVSKSYITT